MNDHDISLTVTDLESFRRYRENEEMTLAELLRKLRREEPPTDIMSAGTVLHSALERAVDGEELSVVELDGHRLRFEIDAELPLTQFRELHGKRIYCVDGQRVEVRAKVDGIEGRTIDEHKASKSSFDAERYFDSYQWRLYLSIFNAQTCIYNVFHLNERGIDANGVYEWDVRDFNRLPLYRYPELEQDIARQLAAYADFARRYLGAVSIAA